MSPLLESLVLESNTRIVLLVLDGLGDLPHPDHGWQTPLEAARTPNLDALAPRAALGRILPVAPGVTPGSGPGHLALFGYVPVETVVGRGVLEALGAGFELQHGDVAARANFCSVDAAGVGRPSLCGSASLTSPPSPGPRSTATKRCPLPALSRISTSSMRVTSDSSFATRRSQVSVGMRPARRSVTTPAASAEQKFARAATSPCCSSIPAPRASSTPRPTTVSTGS